MVGFLTGCKVVQVTQNLCKLCKIETPIPNMVLVYEEKIILVIPTTLRTRRHEQLSRIFNS